MKKISLLIFINEGFEVREFILIKLNENLLKIYIND